MSSCCKCKPPASGAAVTAASAPVICVVPRCEKSSPADQTTANKSRPISAGNVDKQDFKLLDENYIKKHFKLPQRALYLDPFRRPLITFPMDQDTAHNFNMARKTKINQQILDGYLDASEAISAPSVFPYAKTEAEKRKEAEEDEEVIYIMQLPDYEITCPVHNRAIKTPRFIWHSSKKAKAEKGEGGEMKRGGGPLNRPKPWLLSRHTDFDLLSQW